MARKVICIKLNTAEDLVAYVKSYVGDKLTPEYLAEHAITEQERSGDPLGDKKPWRIPEGLCVLEKIRVISLQSAGQGRVAMVLMPWQLGDHDGEVMIDLTKHALCVYPPTQALESEYVQQTTPLTLMSGLTGGKQ